MKTFPLRKPAFAFLTAALIIATTPAVTCEEKLKVLIIDGQNNHAWNETTPVMVSILEASGRFAVSVSTSPASAPRGPRAPQDQSDEAKATFAAAMKAWEADLAKHKEGSSEAWEQWRPDFAAYDVVVSNYNGELWPEPVREAFEAYVKGGGGFVPVHAANNAFPEWPAYNEMIGVGGWGGRSELSGPYLRIRGGKWTNDPTAGRGGAHGRQHEFIVETQVEDHPVTRGLPGKWMHAQDELYDRLRGPARDLTVLAAAFASEETGGSGEWEPILMTITYGKGRVFHTTLGHSVVSMSGVGFRETLKRGTEWAATGEVTFPGVSPEALPADRAAASEAEVAGN
jgi:uncharacterized protein